MECLLYQIQLGIWGLPTGRTPGLDLDLVYGPDRAWPGGTTWD